MGVAMVGMARPPCASRRGAGVTIHTARRRADRYKRACRLRRAPSPEGAPRCRRTLEQPMPGSKIKQAPERRSATARRSTPARAGGKRGDPNRSERDPGSADATRSVRRALVDGAAALSRASRVLLLEGAGAEAVTGAQLPAGDDARVLRAAIAPWLDEARRTRRTRLRHGPAGAPRSEQRSCVVAPLVAANDVLGFLYADIDGT